MPRYIKPLEPPMIRQPSDDPDEDHQFILDGSELYLFDLWAKERTDASSTECDIWIRDPKLTTSDPYYGEPVSNGFAGPYRLRAYIEWPEMVPEVTEAGKTTITPSSVWVPRLSLEEAHAAYPIKEGDIIRFWKLPYYDNRATDGVRTANGGYFFDMIQVNETGHINDSAEFVGFLCNLKRRSAAPPELNFNTEKGVDDDC